MPTLKSQSRTDKSFADVEAISLLLPECAWHQQLYHELHRAKVVSPPRTRLLLQRPMRGSLLFCMIEHTIGLKVVAVQTLYCARRRNDLGHGEELCGSCDALLAQRAWTCQRAMQSEKKINAGGHPHSISIP